MEKQSTTIFAEGQPILILLISVLLLSFVAQAGAFAQTMPPVSEADKAKLTKADDLATKADMLIVEANDLYLEASMARQAGDDAGDKQGKKFDDQALRKELEAAKTYQEANKVKIDVYQLYLERYHKAYKGEASDIINGKLLEENAGEYFFRAKTMREEANAAKGSKDSYYKLTEANETELIGIEKLIAAFDFYSGSSADAPAPMATETLPVAESTAIPPTDSVPAYDPYSTYGQPADTYSPAATAADTLSQYDYSAATAEQSTYTQPAPSATEAYPSGTVSYAGTDVLSAPPAAAATAETIDYSAYDYSAYTSTDSYTTTTEQPAAAEPYSNPVTTEAQERIPEPQPATYTGTDTYTESAAQSEPAYTQPSPADSPADYSNTAQPATTVTAEGVVIDNTMLQQYQALRSDTGNAAYPGGYDTQSLIDYLETYRNQSWTEPAADTSPLASQPADIPPAVPSESLPEETNPSPAAAAPADSNGAEIGRVTAAYEVPDNAYDVIYKVQVAANRAPLSQRALQQMYIKGKGVDMINESGWYKYAVGDFETFDEADRFKQASGLKEAFVVAYKRSKKFTRIEIADNAQQQPVSITTPSADNAPCALQYRIQIGASVSPLLPDQIRSLYRGSEQVDMYQEDGWYKYVAGRYCSYDEARGQISRYNVVGAFVIAMADGRKVSLHGTPEAGFTSDNAIVYVVQVGASLSPLKADQIRHMYRGTETVKQIQEEGWYKYQIEVGSNFQEAMRVRNLTSVRGAFVVAYRNGQKIRLSEAIKGTK